MIQREVEHGDHLIPVLSNGLQQQQDDEEAESENVYETIPPYNIPVNFPDVKVSELWGNRVREPKLQDILSSGLWSSSLICGDPLSVHF